MIVPDKKILEHWQNEAVPILDCIVSYKSVFCDKLLKCEIKQLPTQPKQTHLNVSTL